MVFHCVLLLFLSILDFVLDWVSYLSMYKTGIVQIFDSKSTKILKITDLALAWWVKNVIKTRKMAGIRNIVKARMATARNGNGLMYTTRNTRQEEGVKTTQHDYESRPSPPYCLRSIRLSLQVKCKWSHTWHVLQTESFAAVHAANMPHTCRHIRSTAHVLIKNHSLKILHASCSCHNKEHERDGGICVRGIRQRKWFQHACSTKIMPKIPKTSGNVMMEISAHKGFPATRRKKSRYVTMRQCCRKYLQETTSGV